MSLIDQYRKDGVKRVKLAFTDVDGVHRGKYVSLDKFASIVEGGAGFCDCVLGWDIDDQLYDNAKFTGWHTAFPDARYQVDPGDPDKALPGSGQVLLTVDKPFDPPNGGAALGIWNLDRPLDADQLAAVAELPVIERVVQVG